MSEIPIDAKILIAEFRAEQKVEEQRKAQAKQEQSLKAGNHKATNKTMTAREVHRLARGFGFSVEGGRGRHGVHLVSPDGRECPLPVHGGGKTLARGTWGSIRSFIYTNGVAQS